MKLSDALGGYLYGVVIAVDQLANALLKGPADETISSRLNREDIVPVLGPAVRVALNHIDPGHTMKAAEYDDLGLPAPHHLPPLGRAVLESVMNAGDDYLALPEPTLKIAEEEARLRRMREAGLKACPECGRHL